MSLLAFAAAVLLLLLTPGPTNTLLALSGAVKGVRRSLPLMGGELAGYMTTVIPLVTFAGPWLESQPQAANAVRLCAAAWVLTLAVKLWVMPAQSADGSHIDARAVYWTTVMNPKGLIIGLVLVPPVGFPATFAYLGVFAGLILVVASLWLGFGSAILGLISRSHPALIGRVAAGFLVFFAVALTSQVVGWV
ncbi:LysE family translocator [Rhizobium daejeonense]